jgi:drug/metabolite transporter (DMT)-like permease
MAVNTTPGAAKAQPVTLRLLLMVLVMVVFWSSAFAAIRVGLRAFSPAHVALLRYSVSSIVLAVYALLTRMRLPAVRDLPMVFLLGLLGFTIYNLGLNYGEETVPAGTTSLLVAAGPMWMAVLAWLFWHERLRAVGWLGIVASFAGVAIIAFGSNKGFGLNPRAVVLVLASLASSLYSLGQKPFLRRYSALQCTSYAIWAGTILMLPFAGGVWGELQHAPLATTGAIVYLGIVPGAIGYVLWAFVLSRVPTATAASFLYLVPFSAVFIAWLWLGETPSALALIGGALVIAGVVVVTRWGRPPVPKPVM